jgi:hypothetical protein
MWLVALRKMGPEILFDDCMDDSFSEAVPFIGHCPGDEEDFHKQIYLWSCI